jgi:hypothetical protein
VPLTSQHGEAEFIRGLRPLRRPGKPPAGA